MSTISKKLKMDIIAAVCTRDAEQLGRAVDILREDIGMNYNDAYDYVSGLNPIPLAEYDQLLRDFDDMVSSE